MNLYTSLQSYSNFNDTFKKENYKKIPDDWFVIITDIESSTQWVRKGMYKEINTIGAACISSVKNMNKNIPFVFGGDGASFVLPKENKEEILKQLIKVKNSALNNYNFNLRIGCVPVKELSKKKQNIYIAKFKLSNKEYLAKFMGGGVSYADSLIKENKKYQITSSIKETYNFKNLSCRWNPIRSQKGYILTLIVKANDIDHYKKISNKINKVVDLSDQKFNPIKINHMNYKGLRKMIKDEKGYESDKYSISNLLRILEIFFCFLFFNKLINFLPNSLKKYSQSMARYSDYRKFDDLLRMVIDCSQEEVNKIKSILKTTEDINYGYHLSDTALMTCLVESINDGGHIHFIDGNNGGYTIAASYLKEQIKNKKNVA